MVLLGFCCLWIIPFGCPQCCSCSCVIPVRICCSFPSHFPSELPYNDYFEYFGPDFKLHISPSNMTNQNTNEYLEKIK